MLMFPVWEHYIPRELIMQVLLQLILTKPPLLTAPNRMVNLLCGSRISEKKPLQGWN